MSIITINTEALRWQDGDHVDWGAWQEDLNNRGMDIWRGQRDKFSNKDSKQITIEKRRAIYAKSRK